MIGTRSGVEGRRAELRRTLRRFGGPQAFGWRVLGLHALSLLLAPLLADGALSDGSLVAWLVVLLVAQAIPTGIFLAVRPIHARIADPGRAVLLVLPVYLLAGVLRGLAIGELEVMLGLAADPETGYRIVGGLTLVPGCFLIASLIGALHDEHQALVGRLLGERLRLAMLRGSLETLLVTTERDLADEVRVTLEPGIRRLDEAIAGVRGTDGTAAAVEGLRAFIATDLRPLARRLATEPAIVAPVPAPILPDRAVRVPLPARLAVGAGVHPFLATAAVAAVGLPYADRITGGSGLLGYVAIAVVTGITLLAVLRLLLVRVVLPTPVQLATVMLLHAGVGLAISAVLRTLRPDVAAGIQLPAGMMLVGTLFAIADLVTMRRSATEAELAETNAAIETSLAIVRRQTWLARRRLSTLVHGTIQGALHAAALRLGRAEPVDAALVATIRAEIAAAIATIDAPQGDPLPLAEAIAGIATLWQDACSVRASVDPAADAALRSAPDARSAVVEVIREATLNAIRHGAATSVEIAARHVAPDRVVVTVDDDGDGWTGERGRGRGSAILDELTAGWSHVRTASGTHLEARVPLA